MNKQYNKEFKANAVRYYKDHNELKLKKYCKKLAISASPLGHWIKKSDSNDGKVPTRGSGNYSSDAAKENAR